MTAHNTLILGIGKPIEVLTHIHHVEDLMGEDFPGPMSVGTDLAMTLIEGEEKIPFTLRRQGFKWKRNSGSCAISWDASICGNGGSTMCACSQPELAMSPEH
jgi:hypothetical protein